MGFGVWGLGFRVWGLGFRGCRRFLVQGMWVEGLRCLGAGSSCTRSTAEPEHRRPGILDGSWPIISGFKVSG